jgi:hypothetical protein
MGQPPWEGFSPQRHRVTEESTFGTEEQWMDREPRLAPEDGANLGHRP